MPIKVITNNDLPQSTSEEWKYPLFVHSADRIFLALMPSNHFKNHFCGILLNDLNEEKMNILHVDKTSFKPYNKKISLQNQPSQ